MHSDEIPSDSSVARQLIGSQFPEWRDLEIAPFRGQGTDHAIFRLGSERALRLPRRPTAVQQVEKEQRWLPAFAGRLPLAIPEVLGAGEPTEVFPWPWSVYRWIDGEAVTEHPLGAPAEAAIQLADFLVALRSVEATDGPPPGPHNFFRGEPLGERDEVTRQSIAALQGRVDDLEAITAAWQRSVEAPPHTGGPAWIHGDLTPRNLLRARGRLRAVLDFGGLGVGDPACDLIIAWNLLSGEARRAFRARLRSDDATWDRGRGWALSIALVALPYYWDTDPVIVRESRRVIRNVLAEVNAAS